MNLKKIVIIVLVLGTSQVGLSQNSVVLQTQDPVLFTAGSIVVRQSDVKSVSIDYPYNQKPDAGKGFAALSELSGDAAYDEAMRQAEAIARAFQESKMTGIYRLRILVGQNEYDIWNQYQRDVSKVFERYLHDQMQKQQEKIDVLIEKLFVGAGESKLEVISSLDQNNGAAPKKKSQIVDLRLRRYDGEVKVVANLMDRNLTPNSRTTISVMEGQKNDHLRLRNVLTIGRTQSLAMEPELRCDISRIRHSKDDFRMRNPSIKYETKAGCEISLQFN